MRHSSGGGMDNQMMTASGEVKTSPVRRFFHVSIACRNYAAVVVVTRGNPADKVHLRRSAALKKF
jgi:hypothetical protein